MTWEEFYKHLIQINNASRLSKPFSSSFPGIGYCPINPNYRDSHRLIAGTAWPQNLPTDD